jgi:phosphoribosylamine--glycine ligase
VRVLIIGGGGREHALAWKLAQSPLLERLYCAPGNAGIAALAECVDISPVDLDGLEKFALEEKIDLTVAGPEAPLAAGLADRFRRSGLRVFGPGREGARLEWSKVWAKERMVRWGIPTARFAVFDDYEAARRYLEKHYAGRPVVVKADGLASGKGVTVAPDCSTAGEALRSMMIKKVFGEAGERVLIEDCLYGEELSVLAVTDGRELVMLPPSQDHKAIGEGDRGPNTGGMGAYAPAPLLTEDLARKVERSVFRPFLAGLEREGIDYRGVIYAGLMVNGSEINLLEFNVRFGDPETQALIPLLESDLLPLLLAAAEGRLAGAIRELDIRWRDGSAACVVLASGGYPGPYETGKLIRGLEQAAPFAGATPGGEEGLVLFHAGTAFDSQDRIVTAGGRVLGVTAWAKTLSDALQNAYRAAEKIQFDGRYYRRDIGHRALQN